MSESEYLSFELLEDIMDLEKDERLNYLKDKKVYRISPLVEFAYQSFSDVESNLKTLSENTIINQFLSVSKSNYSTLPNLTTLSPKEFEFIKTPETNSEINDAKWEAFLKRVENAGLRAGLEKILAASLAATLGEMVENIICHSETTETGIAGYRWTQNEFEYVVTDAGIGVMKSLQQHPDYQWIKDSSQALKTAIKNGETKFGKNTRHGTGFNLLLNIAKRNGYLRFRSGNHSLILNGKNAEQIGNISEETFVCSDFKGFLTSFTCQIHKS